MDFLAADVGSIEKIQEIAKESWKSAYGEILAPEQIIYMLGKFYSTEEITKQISSNKNYHYYLIRYENKICGFIGIEHHYENFTTKLHRIYLLPETKGLGIGKAALDFVVEKADREGDNRVILNVNKQNSAKKFYEKFGFKAFEEVKIDIGNGFFMDDFLMEYDISK